MLGSWACFAEGKIMKLWLYRGQGAVLWGNVWVPQPRLRSLAKAWSRKHNPKHWDLALGTPMINKSIPQIIIETEIISPACWNSPVGWRKEQRDLFTKECLREAQKKENQPVKLQIRHWGTGLPQPMSTRGNWSCHLFLASAAAEMVAHGAPQHWHGRQE